MMVLFCSVPQILSAQRSDLPYVPGESLTYVVNYKWGAINTDVGEAVTSLSYIDTLGLFHSVITGRTYKFYDIIFKVREHFESKFFDDPIKPHYFYRKTQEGKYRIKNTFHFEKDTNLASEMIEARLNRLETMVLMSGLEIPIRAIREYIEKSIKF